MKATFPKETARIVFPDAIKSSDLYFDELHNKWFPVPKHWIGDSQSFHPFFKFKSANK